MEQPSSFSSSTTSYKIAVIGEYGAGKTALIQKFAHQDGALATTEPSDEYYPSYFSQPAVHASVGGRQFELLEVSGSRGRMSNMYELMSACAAADAVVCAYNNDVAANPYVSYSMQHDFDLLDGIRRREVAAIKNTRRRGLVHRLRRQSEPVKPAAEEGEQEGQPEKKKGVVGVVAVAGTFSTPGQIQGTEESNVALKMQELAEKNPKWEFLQETRCVSVNAETGEGVQAFFESVAQAVDKKRKAAADAEKAKEKAIVAEQHTLWAKIKSMISPTSLNKSVPLVEPAPATEDGKVALAA